MTLRTLLVYSTIHSTAAKRLGVASLVCMAGVLSGCAGTPPEPAWQTQSSAALALAQSAYLDGDLRVATLELGKARAHLSRTGDPVELARLELHQCASQVASLDWSECAAFAPLAANATDTERSYADYLHGKILPPAQRLLLPPAQQEVAAYTTIDAQSLGAIARIQDPLSRLVAAATLSQRAGTVTLELMETAINTAAQAGWRHPLLAWLIQQERYATAEQLPALAEATRLRIRIVENQGAHIGTAPPAPAAASR